MPEVTTLRKAKADAIYVERHRQRLKQADVASMTDPPVDQSTVSNAERGDASDETYAAIAKALGIDLPEAGE